MYCDNCGAKVEESSRFCPNCGRRLQKQETASGQKEDNANTGKTSGQSAGNGMAKYRVTFVRPAKFYGIATAVRIAVDGSGEPYKLENGKSIEIRLSPGEHVIEFSLFGMPRKTKIMLSVNGDRTLTCYPSAKGAMVNPLLIKPVVVEDESGKKL